MKKEIETSAKTVLKEKQLQLEEVYSVRRSALEERENYLNEMISKSRETNERTAFLLRQTLSAEIESARMQTEKYRHLESDLLRQRKDLQEEHSKRQALLQVREEELLSRKQDLDDVVRQEVERLRKCDEVELLNGRKEIEIVESRIKIEKDALEAQLQQILSIQKEVTEKSALFSEMEVIDYQTLKMKLKSSNNEVDVLKRRLKEAFEEIEALKEGTAVASAEKNLLSSVRQENLRLQNTLENERNERNQERVQLNKKLEELRTKKNRLEERVRSQECELSRLRTRLANQCRRPTEASITASSGINTHSNIPSVSTPAAVYSSTTSAAIKTARERLKALECESTQVEEALSRWREELFAAPTSTSLHQANSTGDVHPASLPGNGLAAAYLTSFRSTSNIPALRQLPPNWPMPYLRTMSSVIEGARLGNPEKVFPYFTVKPEQKSINVEQDIMGKEVGTATKEMDTQQPKIVQPNRSETPSQRKTSALNAFCSENFESNNFKSNNFESNNVKLTEEPNKNQPRGLIFNEPETHPNDIQETRASTESPALENLADSQKSGSSQCAIQHDVHEARVNSNGEINEELNRKDFVDLVEQDNKVNEEESSVYSITGSALTDISSGRAHLLTHIMIVNIVNVFPIPPTGLTTKHNTSEESDSEFTKPIENFANTKEKEEKEAITSEASSNAGVDPTILKYMKVVEEENKAEKPKEEELFNSGKPEEKASSSFTAFLLARQSDSDSSKSERERAASGRNSAGEKRQTSNQH
ncbi:hypothetical protein Aperf_G00000094184 [Anoplocephala perfoliata]